MLNTESHPLFLLYKSDKLAMLWDNLSINNYINHMRAHITTLNRFLLPLLLLSGCSSSLQELKSVSPAPDGFSNSLASEYLAYAESEAEQGRTSSSEHFASKGLRAAKGEQVELDSVDSRTEGYKWLSDYRADLINALNDNVKYAEPQKAARAQVLFDCWNEQEKEGLTVTAAAPAIVSCKQELDQVYDEISQLSDSFHYGDDSKKAIRFVEGSAALDEEERGKIKKIAAHVRKFDDYKIELKTYHAGSDRHLPQRRLTAVSDELIKDGVPKAKILLTKVGKENADDAVHLSTDKEQSNHDVVYILVTYKHNLPIDHHDE